MAFHPSGSEGLATVHGFLGSRWILDECLVPALNLPQIFEIGLTRQLCLESPAWSLVPFPNWASDHVTLT